MTPVLSVRDLRVGFATDDGQVRAVDGVSFDVARSEVLAIVGESGCGKSVTAQTLIGLTRSPNAVITGSVIFDGRDLNTLPDRELQKIRGARIAMVFQDPMTSLNPVYRVMIAMALALEPEVLIADEPTTALDVTIQAQILDLLRTLNRDKGVSVVLITHDLGVVAELADRVVVMYAGQVVEQAGVDELFAAPGHPYTRGLLASIPRLDSPAPQRLSQIPGHPPSLLNPPTGCRFAARCPEVFADCVAPPPLLNHGAHEVRCWKIGTGV